MLVLLSFVSYLFSVSWSQCSVGAPSVTVGSGTICGTEVAVGTNLIDQYIGIPYAFPPIGNRRFAPSELYNINYPGGYIVADQISSCIQFPLPGLVVPGQSEDCLKLNVHVPQNPSVTGLLPVVVYIHGGVFFVGWKDDPFYNMNNFITFGGNNVIGVGITYRLGPLGVYASEEIENESGTTGGINFLGDVIVALQWVQENIGAFGGDKDRVTLYGESSGGVIICYLLALPYIYENNLNLFDKTILSSGSCRRLAVLATRETALQRTADFHAETGVSSNLADLRAMDVNTLYSVLVGAPTFERGLLARYWIPSVDGLFVETDFREIFDNIEDDSDVNSNKVLYGFNSLDTAAAWPSFLLPSPQKNENYENWLKLYLPKKRDRKRIMKKFYPLEEHNNSVTLAWWQIISDTCWNCDTWDMVRIIAENTNIPSYLYYFPGINDNQLVPHGGDLVYSFNVPFPFSFIYRVDYDPAFALEWLKTLTSFAIDVDLTSHGLLNDDNTYDENGGAFIATNPFRVDDDFIKNYHGGACKKFWFKNSGSSSSKSSSSSSSSHSSSSKGSSSGSSSSGNEIDPLAQLRSDFCLVKHVFVEEEEGSGEGRAINNDTISIGVTTFYSIIVFIAVVIISSLIYCLWRQKRKEIKNKWSNKLNRVKDEIQINEAQQQIEMNETQQIEMDETQQETQMDETEQQIEIDETPQENKV